jgi:transposase
MAETNQSTSMTKGARITGAQRDRLHDELKSRYEGGESIRSIAKSMGRSYGFVHNVLAETDVELRKRGGANRRKA